MAMLAWGGGSWCSSEQLSGVMWLSATDNFMSVVSGYIFLEFPT